MKETWLKKLTIAALLTLTAASFLFAEISTEPILMLNTEMHTSAVQDIAVDAAGTTVLTCSFDKTARLWDANSGEMLRVLRPPLHETLESRGILYSCALSPDGRLAAVGGSTIGHCVCIFETSTGALIRSIGPNPSNVLDIEFSHDGAYLALGLAKGGVKIVSCTGWQEVVTLEGYADRVESLAFSTNGYLATICYDGYLRLYDRDFELVNERSFEENPHLDDVSFNPDGSLIVLGGSDKQIEVLDSNNLQTLYVPDTSGANSTYGLFFTVCFSPDGQQLYAAGYYKVRTDNGWRRAIRCWQDAGKGKYADYPVGSNTITTLKPIEGGLLFAGTYPEWGRLGESGVPTVYKKAGNYDYRNNERGLLRVNSDGTDVGFTPVGGMPMLFSMDSRTLKPRQSEDPAYTDKLPGMAVSDWKASSCPKLNSQILDCLKPYELSFCVDTVSEPERMVLGTTWRLCCLDNLGKLVWEKQTLSMVCEVKISGDGKTVVAALSDGTLRWYRLADGKLLMTLYPESDGIHWILYTPAGFYDCAPASEDLIGWHLNQSADKEALFYPVSRFRNDFYRPDLIDRVLSSVDGKDAPELAEKASETLTGTKAVSDILPPSVKITAPLRNAGFNSESVTLEYQITSPNNEPVTGIKVLIDGRPILIQKNLALPEGKGSAEIFLPQQTVRVGVIAENKFGKSEMDEIRLIWNGDAGLKLESDKPDLYALVIGISDYKKEGYKLKYSAKDARDFAASLQSQEGLQYKKVNVRLLTNDDASREAILDGLDWLQSSCRIQDTAVIFLSGHGVNDNIGLFYFLPVSANIARLKSTCIPFSDFENTLGAIPGKVVVFADACHSGGIYTDASVGKPDITRLVNELSADEVGAVIFSSCTPRQLSYENDTWRNGAFTKALVEGIDGSADLMHKNKVSVKSLDLYVSDRVSTLTSGAQTPTTIVPQSIPDFDFVLLPQTQDK
jgi:WD40 repeat protein